MSTHRLDAWRQVGQGGYQPVSVLVPTFTCCPRGARRLHRAGNLPCPCHRPRPRCAVPQPTGACSSRAPRPRPRPRPQGLAGRGDSRCATSRLRQQQGVPTPRLLRRRRRERQVLNLLPGPGAGPWLQHLLGGARRHTGSPLQRLQPTSSSSSTSTSGELLHYPVRNESSTRYR